LHAAYSCARSSGFAPLSRERLTEATIIWAVDISLLDRRQSAAHALGDDRLDRTTARAAELIASLRDEIAWAREQRDTLDDETREPWQALIDIDEDILAALRLHSGEQIKT
jgi:hypothetical protein